ncbi:fibropellin-1-like [Branchiostoma floridae]|uniref:Fibropellin-1-like n=1 Tax=Branchiostoma floridae TaxID=7739 RepID=A0A9J7LTQ2_BRAFL|nr:fibropellin-1-like [Branchiostoma floridae]
MLKLVLFILTFAVEARAVRYLRLAGGKGPHEGRVEVSPWWNEPWGTVCDDSWDLHDAEVVCRQLGYSGAWEAPKHAYFGMGSGRIYLDEVMCNGDEQYLSDCPHNGWETHDCGHHEDAGVVCIVQCSTNCMNGGTCMNDVCRCSPGYTGSKCETEIDECSGSPCMNGARCRDEVNGFTCECEPGWNGARCEQNINECWSNPCMNGGTCIDIVNGYICDCISGQTGRNCENAYCSSNPCMNGGTCENGRCLCVQGYQGHLCQLDVDECTSSPCLNNAECFNEVPGYTCHCPPGYAVVRCGMEVNECASNPCWRGGTCIDGTGSYTCVCKYGSAGQNCEIALNNGTCYWFSDDSQAHETASTTCADMGGHLMDVKEPNEQQWIGSHISDVSEWTSLRTKSHPNFVYNDGAPISNQVQWTSKSMYSPHDTCVLLDSADGYRAVYTSCTEQYNYVCESPAMPRVPNMCHNGGQALTCFSDDTIFCSCQPGYTGLNCETDIDECASNPCLNGGTCLEHLGFFQCECPGPFTRDRCEDSSCVPNPCPFSWTCVGTDGGISCLMPSRKHGRTAFQCTNSSCHEGWTCKELGTAGYTCIAP